MIRKRKGLKKPVFKAIKKTIQVMLIGLIVLAFLIGARYLYVLNRQIKEVNQWRSVVARETANYQIEPYTDIVLAIILTESKGNHIDLMQSSESKYGETNQIGTSEESIESGVKHLAEMIHSSEENHTDIWTAVQAYNFGQNYIPYVKSHGGFNYVELAEEYSKDILAPTLGNKDQTRYRYLNPRAVWYNGGYLYQDGGNFFYAEIVQYHLKWMKVLNK